MRARLASDETARKDFALDVRRLLAVAEEAQAHGVDKAPDMKRQLEFQKASVIAQFFPKHLAKSVFRSGRWQQAAVPSWRARSIE